jgi:prevent-host-death family protein
MSYTVHEAKTNLSRLIREAESGKEVIITRGKEPVAIIVPVTERKQNAFPVD